MMLEEVEYLTEWPPQAEEKSAGQKRGASTIRSEPASHLSAKKPKTEENKVLRAQLGTDLDADEKRLTLRSSSVPITTLLAQWWKLRIRKNNRIAEQHDAIPSSSHNPHTLLSHIVKLPEAEHFLVARAHYLESLPANGESHHALSTTYHRLHQYGTALSYARLAVGDDPGNQEMAWNLELLVRQNNVVQKRNAQISTLNLATDLKMPQPTQVERRCASELSFEEFFTLYAHTHTPVVITGMVSEMTAHPWTLDYIKQEIGSKTAPLRRRVVQSVEWAGLEPAGETSVSQFIDSLHDQTTPCTELKYLFDWSLPLHCPELARQLTIPCYFAGDFLQRTPPGSLYRDSWPSLFVSPAGITSELHVDAFGSNFWMALFQGKKRWVFFPPEDLSLLYPTYTHSTDAAFDVTLSQPDLDRHPLLSLTHPRECVLSPGELLFVPAGSPHRVENLEPSLAISANFVDRSNFDRVLAELSVIALRDQRAGDLLHVLEGPSFDNSTDYQQKSLSWKEFKRWPRMS